MELHGNARLTPVSRDLLCRRVRVDGWTVAESAFAVGVSERTAYRWLTRFDAGEPLTDRSSRPGSFPNRTPVRVEAAASYEELAAATHRAGRRSSAWSLDLMIAATAHAHGARLIKANVDDVRHLDGLLEIVRG